MNKRLVIVIAGVFVLVILAVLFLFSRRAILPVAIGRSGFSSAYQLLGQARSLEAKNQLLESKGAYQKLVSDFPNSSEVMSWQKKADELNIKLLFSPVITPGSILYEIKPGDTLIKIAKQFNTTPELIMKSNGLGESKIYPGRKIKVWNSPFSVLVYKSQNLLILKSNDEIIKTYVVSTGHDNCTPVGNFKIVNKLLNPTWFKAGAVVSASSPQNILGTRWLGFDLAGYGIHGTTEPQHLGKQVTAGCVRMANPEVEEVYTIIPVGTEVTIVD